MSILISLSVFVLLSVPSTNSELQEFQYSGSGLALITPFSSGIIAIPWGYGSALYLGRGSSARIVPWPWEESRCCSAPSSCGDSAAICIDQSDSRQILLFSPDSVLDVFGPYEKGGQPVFDGLGNIWFTADGFLYRNGTSTGIELEAYTISVDPAGNRIIFCDSEDRICILNIASAQSSILASDYRFYSPVFVVCEGTTPVIVAPTLEGEILKISPSNGECTSLANGSMPFWWKEREAILFSVTSDDGHMITASEVWSVSLDGVSQQLTFSPDIHEIHPMALDETVFAIEAITGSLITLPDR